MANEQFFLRINTKPESMLYQIAREPFVETSLAAHGVLLSLANQNWALKRYIMQPGLMEFLLDRQAVNDKALIEIRYEIMKVFSQQPRIDEIFPSDVLTRVRQYVNDGVFHSTSGSQVAYDQM